MHDLKLGNARTMYENWLSVGPVHHCCTSRGHFSKQLEFLCQEQGWTWFESLLTSGLALLSSVVGDFETASNGMPQHAKCLLFRNQGEPQWSPPQLILPLL